MTLPHVYVTRGSMIRYEASPGEYTKELGADADGTSNKLSQSTAPRTPPIYLSSVRSNKNDGAAADSSNGIDQCSGAHSSTSTLSSADSLAENVNKGARLPGSCSNSNGGFLFSSDWLGSREMQLRLPDMHNPAFENTGSCMNDETDSIASGAYFDPVDLDPSNWMKAIRMDGPTFGFALVAVATALVHPVLFVAGALTALGTLHAVGVGYEYCSIKGKASSSEDETENSWGSCMLSVCLKELPRQEPALVPELTVADSDMVNSRLPQLGIENLRMDAQSSECNCFPVSDGAEMGLSQEPRRVQSQGKKSLSVDLVERTFPPLEQTVVSDVVFPGLHAIEFFRVFFADDAPYHFQELQKQRGDLDIVYGQWKQLSDDQPIMLHTDTAECGPCSIPPEFSCGDSKFAFRGRVLSFRAKTNNFMGPVYATTRKTQRVLLHSKNLIVMESRTDLSGIPFCDRFYVLERWIVQAQKVSDHKYVSTLSATSQVVFTQSCQFSAQIKSKSTSTIRDLVACWCAMAKEALKLTEQCKKVRLENEQDEDSAGGVDDSKMASGPKQQIIQTGLRLTEDEGIEVTWSDITTNPFDAFACRHRLRHTESAPLPPSRVRPLHGLRRSLSSLWSNRR